MTDAAQGLVSIGIAGTLEPAAIAAVARAVEECGFHALWVNDTPGGDALAALAAAARVTDRLVLGTGVLPVDRHPADAILARVRALALPEDRLVLGLGAGQLRDGVLERVGETVRALRAGTSARVMIGALGPRMRRLAASVSDGPLFSWLPPAAAAAQAAEAHRAAPGAHVALYVRTSLDAAGAARRDAEAAAYGGYAPYAANFARLGITPGATVLPLPGDRDLAPGLAAYRASVDELVLRAIPGRDEPEAYVAFVRALAERA
ncbi:LLM class flavin-dependent oxidoreductase [Microbacterium sp. X-17]|uniref:LLM class flavin-dependent oxidoreductase n=1 Tax=Microbacterium sp. X-17 TaxID=3144404 RepID=UPI0031F5787F